MIKRVVYGLIVLVISLSFAACSSSKVETPKELSMESPLHFLASLPGANCSNQYQLDLFENKTFFERSSCFKNGVASKNSDDIGRWFIDKENRIVLNGTKRRVKYFRIIDTKTIELLDLEGNKIDSKLNYKLQDSRTAKTLEPQLFMMGMYSYMADSALFYECSSGLKFPIAFEADNIALEKAYLKVGAAPGQALKIHLNAKITQRKLVDRSTKGTTLVVEKFIDLIPKEVCQNPYSKAKLQNTYWKLTRLYSKAVALSKNSRREAHILLSGETIKGNSSCNNFSGRFESEGKKLSLRGGVMMSRMFCKDSLESDFMKVLHSMQSYKLDGEYLEIFDKKGESLARFESVYLH